MNDLALILGSLFLLIWLPVAIWLLIFDKVKRNPIDSMERLLWPIYLLINMLD